MCMHIYNFTFLLAIPPAVLVSSWFLSTPQVVPCLCHIHVCERFQVLDSRVTMGQTAICGYIYIIYIYVLKEQ